MSSLSQQKRYRAATRRHTGKRWIRTLAGLLPVLLFGPLAVGCQRAVSPPREGVVCRDLLDGSLAPDVLIEQPELELSASRGANRFVSGWRPRRGKTGRRGSGLVAARPPVRLELAHLEGRARQLQLDLDAASMAEGGEVQATAAGLPLGSFPLADPFTLVLPADLPTGRVTVELSPETPFTLAAARVRPVLEAGQVQLGERGLSQSPSSMVELVVPTAAGGWIEGHFRPPASAGEASFRLELLTEEPGAVETPSFVWRPGLADLWRRRHLFRLSLPPNSDFVALRLSALGPAAKNATGLWEELRLCSVVEESSPPAAPAEEHPPPAPRIVLVYVMDALRRDALSPYGAPSRHTPTIERLAREGMIFSHHRSTAPKTRPSTWALFTGRTFRGSEQPTLAEAFREAGFQTALFSGNPNVSQATGLDRGFEHVDPSVLFPAYGRGHRTGAEYNDNAEQVHAAALSWLETLQPTERAFLYLHTIHPHSPYDPPQPHLGELTAGIPSAIDGSSETLFAIKQSRLRTDGADRRRLEALYAASVAYNDAQLGRLLAAMSELLPLEEVLLVLTSDHGEELFDHGGLLHGHTLYGEQLDIPLLLWAPGFLAPAEVRRPTSSLDLHATLLDLAQGGAGDPLMTGSPAVDAGSPPPEPEVHFATASYFRAVMVSAQSQRWKVVWAPRTGRQWGMGEGLGRTHDPEYWFDLERDPGETLNRVGEAALEPRWLRSRLFAWIERESSATAEPEPPELDDDTRARLRALGYLD